MRIRFTLDIERSRPEAPAEREVDLYSSTETRDHPRYIGFQREDEIFPDDRRRS
jgi:hypothetical protein